MSPIWSFFRSLIILTNGSSTVCKWLLTIDLIPGSSESHGRHQDRNRLQGDGNARRSEGTPAQKPGTSEGRPEICTHRTTLGWQQARTIIIWPSLNFTKSCNLADFIAFTQVAQIGQLIIDYRYIGTISTVPLKMLQTPLPVYCVEVTRGYFAVVA